jgi:L-serine dehydratase
MELSIFELLKIGIGPSSSHTVGPMRAASFLLDKLRKHQLFATVERIQVELFGSLGSTGKGHGTDRAVVWGLLGEAPETIDTTVADTLWDEVAGSGRLRLGGMREIAYSTTDDILFKGDELLPYHPNGMRFTCIDGSGEAVYTKDFYSIGGGFIVGHKTARDDHLVKQPVQVRYPFHSADELLAVAGEAGISIAELVRVNENSWRSPAQVDCGLDQIHQTMQESIERGFSANGILPGRLQVERRAPAIHQRLCLQNEGAFVDPLAVLDWVVLYALAVNEENASAGRIVTAPTNGSAGVVPAVVRYYQKFVRGSNRQGIHELLLTAGAIGLLYKTNASISGAEVGCQGEIGVSCSMAAAGLAAVLGGTLRQVENAAEIAMEHNLGLTCDPIDGLVQIPCIERNAMAAVKAINAARIALQGSGCHHVSLDQVMRTMRETGRDMKSQYKETSTGGLAINITEC